MTFFEIAPKPIAIMQIPTDTFDLLLARSGILLIDFKNLRQVLLIQKIILENLVLLDSPLTLVTVVFLSECCGKNARMHI